MAERLDEVSRDRYALNVLKRVFVEPSRFGEVLSEVTPKIAPDMPTGVATAKSLEAELQVLDVPRAFIRDLATYATGRLTAGGFPGLFPPGSPDSVEYQRTDAGRFYRRNDFGLNEAADRYSRYMIALAEEAADAKAEGQKPSVATVRLISTSSLEKYNESVENLKSHATGRVRVEEIPFDLQDGVEPVVRVIQRPDTREILDNGLNTEQFDGLIKNVREGIIERVSEDEEIDNQLAADILNLVNQKLKRRGQEYDMPIFIPKDVTFIVARKLADLNQNSNINFQVEVESAGEGVEAPFPRHVATRWFSRFDEKTLTAALPKIKQSQPEMGDILESALLSDESEKVFRDLRVNGKLEYNGSSIEGAALSKELEPIVLPDQLISQVVMADIIGEMHPMPYVPGLEGKTREFVLFALRYFGSGYSEPEIRSLLAPHLMEQRNPQVDRLKNQMSRIEAEITRITGSDKPSQQSRAAKIRKRDKAASRLKTVETQKSSKVSNRDLVRKSMEDKFGLKKPDPKDYEKYEESVGYKEALERYEKVKDLGIEKQPDPEDYILGEESIGFMKANSLYTAWSSLEPEGWMIGYNKPGRNYDSMKLGLGKLVVPALLRQGVVPPVLTDEQKLAAERIALETAL